MSSAENRGPKNHGAPATVSTPPQSFSVGADVRLENLLRCFALDEAGRVVGVGEGRVDVGNEKDEPPQKGGPHAFAGCRDQIGALRPVPEMKRDGRALRQNLRSPPARH